MIAIVGAGAAGLAMGMGLRRAGFTDFQILERSTGVGGTWHDNRYPGAACDVPSHLYCFSFAPKSDWQYKFARQPEIEQYFQDCARRFGLLSHLRLGTEVTGARFSDGAWRIATSVGEVTADVLITGTGQLNRPRTPREYDAFAGTKFHSARWDTSYDFTGKRVIVVGNGASAVQFVPEIAPLCKHLTVLQRTPAYVIPRNDHGYSAWRKWVFGKWPVTRELYRAYIYWSLEARFTALYRDSKMGKLVSWMALRHLRAQVSDPVLRAKLTPDYPIGCKRIVISDDWYPTLTRPNVSVVTSPVERVTADSVITKDGVVHGADAIIFATGFYSTEFLAPMQIVGKHGAELRDTWRGGAYAHRGVTISGYPNLFLLYGPNTNLGHNSIIFMIECQVRYILRCLEEMRSRGARWLDVKRDVMERSNAELQHALERTTWSADCRNWYKTEDGKITNNWSGRTAQYWWQMREPDMTEFELS